MITSPTDLTHIHQTRTHHLLPPWHLYLSHIIIYGACLLLVRYGPYYSTYLQPETQTILLYLYVGFIIFSPFYYFFFATPQAITPNKSYYILLGMGKLFHHHQLTKEEKVSFLFLGVKLFYLPLMTNFLINNIKSFFDYLPQPTQFPFILTTIFLIDTFIFTVGYAFEGKKLNNVVKSVEPTLLGWIVTLICYPPFNALVGNYIPWGANDYATLSTPTLTALLRGTSLFLLIIYLWASIALGTKASNLTNRGIVTKFPYSLIRHPAYTGKVFMWWLTLLPFITVPFFLGMLFWTIIYYLRAITEERHLSQDPEYIAYKQKVRFKFIPGVW